MARVRAKGLQAMATGVPALSEILLAGLLLIVATGLLGYRLAHRLFPDLDRFLLAPSVGLALYLALTLPASLALGLGWGALAALAVAAGIVALLAPRGPAPLRIGTVGFAVVAAILAGIVASTITPHVTDEAIAVGAPVLDHGKVALIDEMVRSGLPPGNPFVGSPEGRPMIYYYLWFVPAAQLRLVTGISTWAADIAMTWLSAVASIGIVGALANRLAGLSVAMWLTLPVLLTGRLRETIDELRPGILGGKHGLEPWLIQAPWAPQHLVAAGMVVLGTLAIWRLIQADRRMTDLAGGCGMLAGVAFGCSTWVGGVAQLVILLPFLVPLLRAWRHQKPIGPMAFNLAIAGMVAVGVAFPLLLQQLGSVGGRPFPIGLVHFAVFDPGWLGRYPPLELIGFWLVTLLVDLPGLYPAGLLALGVILLAPGRAEGIGSALPWLALAIAPLLVAQFLRSVIAGNDLAWRSILVPQLVMAAAIAAAITRVAIEPRFRAAAAVAIVMVLVALPFGVRFLETNSFRIHGAASPSPAQREFRKAPELWAAVRRHTPPSDAVLNNPESLQHLTPTHGNLGWALLADRRSCISSTLWLLAFANMPPAQILEALQLAQRFFGGEATEADERRLVDEFACRTVVVTPDDRLWTANRLAASARWRLVDEKQDAWRIYRVQSTPSTMRPSR